MGASGPATLTIAPTYWSFTACSDISCFKTVWLSLHVHLSVLACTEGLWLNLCHKGAVMTVLLPEPAFHLGTCSPSELTFLP